jgi:hypothetical protein
MTGPCVGGYRRHGRVCTATRPRSRGEARHRTRPLVFRRVHIAPERQLVWVYATQLVPLPRPVGTGSPVPLPSSYRGRTGLHTGPGRLGYRGWQHPHPQRRPPVAAAQRVCDLLHVPASVPDQLRSRPHRPSTWPARSRGGARTGPAPGTGPVRATGSHCSRFARSSFSRVEPVPRPRRGQVCAGVRSAPVMSYVL